jgi:Beta/Gamma crystallin
MNTIFRVNKKQTALALLAMTLLGGTILTLAKASAQTQPSGVVKDVTLWSKPNRQGALFESNKGVPDLGQVGFDNKASSIAVNNGQKWRFYQDKNFKGEFIEIGPDESRGNLGKLNNQVSSFKSVP